MKERILVVDDSSSSSKAICRLLVQDYQVATAGNLSQCWRQLKAFRPDLVLLNGDLTTVDGYVCCRQIKQRAELSPHAHVIFIAARPSQRDRLMAYNSGADDYLVSPYEPGELLAKVRVHLRMRAASRRAKLAEETLGNYSSELERLVDARTATIQSTQDVAVFALARLADSRDPETGDHLVRMRFYSQLLAEHLSQHGPYTAEIDDKFLHDLYRSSPLHDIGKVGVHDAILLKPGSLTPEEYAQMQRHVEIGAATLAEAARLSPSGSFFDMATEIARYHHERWDGAGYPAGVSGLRIPLAARIVSLADVFDAISSDRVYRPAMPPEEVRRIIEEEEGKHFDPAVVDAFRACYDKFLTMVNRQDVSYNEHPQVHPTLPRWRVDGERSSLGGEERVLVVDDDPTQVDMLVHWLRKDGYDAIGASGVESALASIREECPHFVIADWVMPEYDGGDLCRWLRSEALPRYVYTIVATASDEVSAVEVFNAGADDFVHKPIQRNELLARLRSATRVVNLEAKLSALARVDLLTGLSTRQFLEEQMQREWDRSNRYTLPLSCAVLGIDGLESIVQEFGVGARDAALQQVAAILSSVCRETDYLCRLNGERFLALMAEANEDQAANMADRIRLAVSQTPILYQGKTLPVTMSAGIAQGEEQTTSLEALVHDAERAFESAIQMGANLTVSAGSLRGRNPLEQLAHGVPQSELRTALASQVMTRPILCLRDNLTAQQAARFLLRHRLNSAPVVDNQGLLVGTLSDMDLMTNRNGDDCWQRQIAEFMRTDTVSFEETVPVLEIYQFLCRSAVRRVIVVKKGRPTGVVSRSTMLRWFTNLNERVGPETYRVGELYRNDSLTADWDGGAEPVLTTAAELAQTAPDLL